MDPNANLAEQLKLAREMEESFVGTSEFIDKGLRLAELVIALNDWQRSGGFAPTPI